MDKDVIIFTDIDLDGSCSYLIYTWLTGKKYKAVGLKVSSMREKVLDWLKVNSFEDYKRVYFFDLDTSEIGDLIDKSNVFIFDHHKTHKYKYTNAKTKIDPDCTSCSKLLYKHYKDKINLTNEQKHLIALVNDYDNYDLKFPESNKLNFLFYYQNGNKLQNFIDNFEHGFHGFTDDQNKIISYHIYKYKKVVSELNLFKCNIPIAKKDYMFYSAFVQHYVNEVGQHIVDTHDCDVCMMINLHNNRVYLRKSKNCDLDLGKFAKKMCEGGGHEYAAGGVLNENILTLSKQFEPVNG